MFAPQSTLMFALNHVLKGNMSTLYLSKIFQLAGNTEQKIFELKKWVENLKKTKLEEEIKKISEENKVLAAKVEAAKIELIKLETQNGKKQYPIPGKAVTAASIDPEPKVEVPPQVKKEKNVTTKSNDTNKAKNQTPDVADVRKLDFRIGKIIEINKHPDADSLYVEKIDCGEDKLRTVVSGLVNHVPIDEMRDRMVMILCNLKPVKMRGVTSEAMVMCASSPEKVEVLVPPSEAVPGDLVVCEGYPREPEPVLNPKKKIFETCAPDLMTNDKRIACYKGTPLQVPGKGPVMAPTLKGVNVK